MKIFFAYFSFSHRTTLEALLNLAIAYKDITLEVRYIITLSSNASLFCHFRACSDHQ
jgi:hypothetical protein